MKLLSVLLAGGIYKMIEYFKGLVGPNTSPAAKITSAIISMTVLALIYFNFLSQYMNLLFGFLVFHLFNHLYSAIEENRTPYCYKCGVALKKTGFKFEKHKCSSDKELY